MEMKGCSAFPKAAAILEPHHEIVKYHIQDTRLVGGSYSSEEEQSVYSTAPADWAINESGIIQSDFLLQGHMINLQPYKEILLQIHRSIRKKRWRLWLLNHDSSSTFKAPSIQKFPAETSIAVEEQPPY